MPNPRQFGISNYEDLQIPTPDGESLHALFIRPENKRLSQDVTVLMFHGNAGNIGHRIPIAKILQEVVGCNVLMVEYRGYGLSTGVPDEAGLKIDAQTGLDYIRQRAETRDSKIIVYGQSLGGAVAINLVAQNQDSGVIAGLILENTFLSIRKLIPSYVDDESFFLKWSKLTDCCRVFPPARYLARLCHQYWLSEEALPKITEVPILFMSGLKDEIVPYVTQLVSCIYRTNKYSPSNMTQLFAVCNSKRKIWRTLPNGGHNDSVAEPGYFEHILSFITEEVVADDR